ncbi:hypothetical protein GJ675_10410 [Hafnia alvei]|nr:hypothetical protein [Hafnia alvei]NLS54061.1 hypothetical protein [Hafnia alvei]
MVFAVCERLRAEKQQIRRDTPYNYQRLLNRIDSSVSPYSSQEYLSAIHNPSYRDVKNKMIVRHPSEWYRKKETPIWQSFLNKLTSNAPEWREYCEDYLEKMVWIQDASKLKLGSSLWHMHPVEFLGTLRQTLSYWELGKTSEHFESGGRGPSVVSTGKGDHGGISYGKYQFSSKMGVVQKYILHSKFKSEFEALTPATSELNKVWKKLQLSIRMNFQRNSKITLKKRTMKFRLTI